MPEGEAPAVTVVTVQPTADAPASQSDSATAEPSTSSAAAEALIEAGRNQAETQNLISQQQQTAATVTQLEARFTEASQRLDRIEEAIGTLAAGLAAEIEDEQADGDAIEVTIDPQPDTAQPEPERQQGVLSRILHGEARR